MADTLKRCEYCNDLNLPLVTKCEHCGGHKFKAAEDVANLYRSGSGQALKDRLYIGSHLCLSGPMGFSG